MRAGTLSTWAFLLLVLGLFLAAMAANPTTRSDDSAGIDWERARLLHREQQAGQPLSAEDQAFLARAEAEYGRLHGNIPPSTRPDGPSPATRPALPLTPMTQMPASANYKGEDGGLYGGGRNEPPADQLKAARDAAAKIQTLDGAGQSAQGGAIVLMSIGMSNTTMEFQRFMRLAENDSAKSSDVLLVDGAQGGQDAATWATQKRVWEVADKRLLVAGVTPKQVQVVWIKQALAMPAKYGEFPKHSDALAEDLIAILTTAKQRYPNLRLAYLSSRIYAGYATIPLNPEPYAYEEGFGIRKVVLAQIRGDPRLNADPAKGPVKAPVVLWGPYLWADGANGRRSDSLIWLNTDFAADGTHPNTSGRQKVAMQLLGFFKSDPTARNWFLRMTLTPP